MCPGSESYKPWKSVKTTSFSGGNTVLSELVDVWLLVSMPIKTLYYWMPSFLSLNFQSDIAYSKISLSLENIFCANQCHEAQILLYAGHFSWDAYPYFCCTKKHLILQKMLSHRHHLHWIPESKHHKVRKFANCSQSLTAVLSSTQTLLDLLE